MLKATMFEQLASKNSNHHIVNEKKELLARQTKRSSDFQITLEARRVNRIALANAEAMRNHFLSIVLENQELLNSHRLQKELKYWNERITQLKLSLR